MPKGASGGFYAVRIGRTPGVYMTWDECQNQVKGFQKARYKKFPTQEQAEEFVADTGGVGDASKPQCGATRMAPSCTAPSDSNHSNALGDQSAAVMQLQTLSNKLSETTSLLGDQLRLSRETLQGLRGKLPSSEVCCLADGVLTQAVGQVKSLKGLVSQLRSYSTDLDQSSAKRSRSGTEDEKPEESKRWKSDDAFITGAGSTHRTTKKVAEVYTDGCCHSNGKATPKAGLGVYWGPNHPNNTAMRLLGRQTNNRAEIHAARKAIQQAQEHGYDEIIIHTDSQFLINCITKWIQKWKKNGWKLANGNNVVNRKDLEQLEITMEGISVTWNHVKGHAGIHGNEEADKLANDGARLPYIKHSAESEDEEYL